MKILVTGGHGMLAQDLIPRLSRANFEVVALDHDKLNIIHLSEVRSLLPDLKTDLVINCAAYTAVDKAESEPEACLAVNRDGVANLGLICANLKIPLVHISTDYVFDGQSQQPYQEDDSTNPVGIYGRSKWAGEEAVRRQGVEFLIIRTSWLYGVHGHNFVKTILRLAGEREELRVVADQHGCPTWTGDLAEALTKIAEQIFQNRSQTPWGTYHFAGSGYTTWYDFAQAILAETRHRQPWRAARIIPIDTVDYPTPARRPAWSVLGCTKIGRSFGIIPRPWREGLVEMLAEFFRGK
jgi:dTDP-4-dehydrorhamnose reductase